MAQNEHPPSVALQRKKSACLYEPTGKENMDPSIPVRCKSEVRARRHRALTQKNLDCIDVNDYTRRFPVGDKRAQSKRPTKAACARIDPSPLYGLKFV